MFDDWTANELIEHVTSGKAAQEGTEDAMRAEVIRRNGTFESWDENDR